MLIKIRTLKEIEKETIPKYDTNSIFTTRNCVIPEEEKGNEIVDKA